MTDYETDFAAWAEEQARLLRDRVVNRLDWENLAEEIESLGISQRHEVRSRLRLICQHLLKLTYQRSRPARSWRVTVIAQRSDLETVLEDSPSLRSFAGNILPTAYHNGRRDAAAETSLRSFPDECPWTLEQVLDHDFWPRMT